MMRIYNYIKRGFVKYHSFTLIELLIIIAIILIIVAMLVPTLEKTIDSARSMTCINNNKQILHGSIMYSEDNHGFIVPVKMDIAVRSIPWTENIWPYVTGQDAPTYIRYGQYRMSDKDFQNTPYVCPGSDYSKTIIENGILVLNRDVTYAESLGCSTYFVPKLRISQVKMPSKKVFFTESMDTGYSTAYFNFHSSAFKVPCLRHSGGVSDIEYHYNYSVVRYIESGQASTSFFDGSVRMCGYSTFFTSSGSMTNAVRWY